MDIEQIKKLNEMTKTLQKHGIAVNAEEGSRIAENVTKTRLPEMDAAVSKEYLELMFERNNRKFIQEVVALKTKIELLEKGMDELRAKGRNERIVIRDAATGEPVRVDAPNNRKITKEDVKNGNDPNAFSKSDVAVENVFYFGNKK
jgi:hypothetical protein